MVCINLMDEAKRKGIHVNLPLLEKRLDVPVVGTTARKKKSLSNLMDTLDHTVEEAQSSPPLKYTILKFWKTQWLW